MRLAFAQLCVFALALTPTAGCKRKGSSSAVLREYRDAVCACKDTACIDSVNTSFSDKLAAEADKPRSGPDDDTLITQIQKCSQAVYDVAAQAGDAGVDDASPAVADLPTGAGSVPAVPAKRQADLLIGAARTWQTHPRIAIYELSISYVDNDGVLDAEFGALQISFGASTKPADDPKRRTGAPVKVDEFRPTECPTLNLEANGWVRRDGSCPDVESYIPKCTLTEIWKRAIKAGAPKDALAVITFKHGDQPTWTFQISDEPRKVNVMNVFGDDCERILEKPK